MITHCRSSVTDTTTRLDPLDTRIVELSGGKLIALFFSSLVFGGIDGDGGVSVVSMRKKKGGGRLSD